MALAQRLAALLSLVGILFSPGAFGAEEIKFKTPGLISLTADFGQTFSEELKNQLTQPEVTGIVWTSPDLPSWLSLNKNTGALSGNPPAASVGALNRFRINAIKNESGELLHPFEVVVRAIPKWDTTDLDLGTAPEDSLFNFNLNQHVTDPLGGTLTFSSSTLPPWLQLDSATGMLFGTPKRTDVGPYQIATITATGKGGSQSIPAHGLVTKTIHPPHWTAKSIPLADATDDAPYTRDVTEFAVNPEGTTLTYTKVSGPAWASISPAGVITGSPTKADVGPVALVARLTTTIDGQSFTDDTTFTFNVKHVAKPPTWAFPDIDLGKAQEDSLFTFDLKTVVTDPEAGKLTFSATGLPGWLSISPNGILTGTPRRVNVGPFSGITVTATGIGGPASAAAHGVVLKTIKPPKWVSNPIVIENPAEDKPYSKNLVPLTVNPEGTTLTFDKVSGAKWASISPAGVLTGTPGATDLGPNSIVAHFTTVIDGQTFQDTTTLNFTVIHTPHPPKWSINDVDLGKAQEDSPFTFDLKTVVTDPEGGTLTFSATGLPPWLAISPAGILSGTPRRAHVGPFAGITLTAVNIAGAASAAAHGVVLKTIKPPKWKSNPIAIENAGEDIPYSKNLVPLVVNPEGTSLVFDKVSGAPWASISPAGLLTGTPGALDLGPTSIVAHFTTVIDGQTFQDTTTLNFTVNHTPKPPKWSINDVDLGKATENVPFTFDLKTVVSDPEGGTLLFNASGLPPWLSISQSGILSGTPRRVHVGPFAGITLTATNVAGNASAQAHGVVLKVINPPKWSANPITLPNAAEGVPYSRDLLPLVINPEGTVLTFDKISGAKWLTISPNGVLSGTPGASDVGAASVVAHFTTTIDGQVFQDTTTLQLNVSHVPKPPIWAFEDIDLGKATEDVPFTFDLKSVVTDPEGGTLTFSATGLPKWLTLAPNGVLTGTPKRADVGPFGNITLTAVGAGGPASAKAHGIVVKTIKAPKWTGNPIALPDATETISYVQDLTKFVTNPEGTILTYDKISGPKWITMTPGGVISGTPQRPDLGKVSLVAHFTTTIDGQVFEDTTTFTFTVKKKIVPPKWIANPLKVTDASDAAPYTQELQQFVLNPEGTPLTFEILNAPIPPPWLSIQSTTGLLFGAPQPENVGPVSVNVRFTTIIDGQTFEDTTTVQFRVLHQGKPPVWLQDPIDLGIQNEGTPFTFDLKPLITNPEGGAVTFTATGLPKWMTLSANGVLSGTPRRVDVGKYSGILFSAIGTGGTATARAFGEVKKVVQPPKWKANPITLENAKVDTLYAQDLTTQVNNPEQAVLTYNLVNGPPWVSISQSGQLSGTPAATDVGKVVVIARFVTTIDGVPYEDTTTFLFSVVPKGKPPIWTQDPIRFTAIVDVPFKETLAPFAKDPDNLPLTFTKTDGPQWMAVNPIGGALSGTPLTPNIGENFFKVKICNPLTLCAEVTVIVTVKKEPPIQIDDVQIDGDVAGAVIENLWVTGNLHHAKNLIRKLKENIHFYYQDLAAANVLSMGVYLSADGRKKGEPILGKNGAPLMVADANIVEDYKYRTDKAFANGLFTKRFNSPIWSMAMFYSKLTSFTGIYHQGWFMPEIPMETLIVTANRDHYVCFAKNTEQANWSPRDFANAFIARHKAEAKPYRISAVTPECPGFTETSCDEKPMTAEGTYQALIHATGGKHYPIHCNNIELESVMHDYAKESIFRAKMAANRRITLSKKPLDPATIKVTIANVVIPQGTKWFYDPAKNQIVIRWDLIDEVKLQPGDRIKIEYKVAGLRTSAFYNWLPGFLMGAAGLR